MITMQQRALQGSSRQDGTVTPVIEAREITVQFGGILALDELNLRVSPGEQCGIIGPNGAGKTTFFDVLSGMRSPNRGQVWFDGKDVSKEGPNRIARHGLRRTFQRHQPFGWLSVEDNVLTALEWRGRSARIVADLLALPSQQRKKQRLMARVDAVLEECGLLNVRHNPAASLPIGQVRLLEFARAAVDTPKVLLLDEPTSGLSKVDTERLGNAMTQIAQSSGCAVILVEHDVDFVRSHCSRLVVLDQGVKLTEGLPDEVLSDPAVIEAYIGQDYEAGQS